MTQSFQTYQGTIYPWHCDHMGHMNVMYYVGKFDEASWNFFAMAGLYGREMRAANKGLVAVEQNIRYQKELLAGDIITIRTAAMEVADKSLKFRHEMHNVETGDLAATTILTGLYFDKTERKAISLPAEARRKLQDMMG